jgi:hypothetical protein
MVGQDSTELMFQLLCVPTVMVSFCTNLLSLKELLLAQPEVVSIGYNNFPSDVLRLLVTVSENIQLTPSDYTFPSMTLLEIIRVMSADKLELLHRIAMEDVPALNG